MATDDNPGQFGNRSDTSEQASKGGSESGGNFAKDREKASRAGKKGAENQPKEAKAKGGRRSGNER